MIEEVRSAFDDPKRLKELDIASFDEDTLRYFMDQVKRVASTWRNPAHRVCMSQALEQVPMMELLPHVHYAEVLDVPDEHQAFIVEVFGFKRGLFYMPSYEGVGGDEFIQSSIFEQICSSQGVKTSNDFEALTYVREWIEIWEDEHDFTQHDVAILNCAGWGDISSVPEYMSLPFVLTPRRESNHCHFDKSQTKAFDFEAHDPVHLERVWREFISRHTADVRPMLMLYGGPPVERGEAPDFFDRRPYEPSPSEVREQLPEGRSRSLLGRLMDWWSDK